MRTFNCILCPPPPVLSVSLIYIYILNKHRGLHALSALGLSLYDRSIKETDLCRRRERPRPPLRLYLGHLCLCFFLIVERRKTTDQSRETASDLSRETITRPHCTFSLSVLVCLYFSVSISVFVSLFVSIFSNCFPPQCLRFYLR